MGGEMKTRPVPCPGARRALFPLVALVLAASLLPAEAQRQRPELPAPDHADLAYGPHERNRLDLWLAKTEALSPLVLYIHGGGFRSGDKRTLNPSFLARCLEAGWSVAAINYRLTDTAPAPAAYLDCGRAIQYLRHRAAEWNLDPELVASTGGSAGAGTSLWLAFHDDLARPGSDDPVERESTRLTCVAVSNGQSSYDPRFAEAIGIPRPNFERHNFFLPFYDIRAEEIDSEEAYRRYEAMAPITYLSEGDPPVMMHYSHPNTPIEDAEANLGLVVHHPLFGIALKERMDALGIECVVQYRDGPGGPVVRHGDDGRPESEIDFIRRHFEAAAR